MSVRQRLYPDPVQVAGLVEHCDHARFVYNLGLEQRSLWLRSKHDRGVGVVGWSLFGDHQPEPGDLDAGRVNTATQMRELAELRADLDWLRAGSSSVQQAALRNLDRAYANFFTGLTKGTGAKYPSFKRRDERNGGFYIRDLSVRRINKRWGQVRVPKLGFLRFRISRTWAEIAVASSARVAQKNGRWHISFTTGPAPKITAGTGAVLGIDRGVANTLATSEATMVSIPNLTAGERARFLALEQRLARQTTAAKKARRRMRECANRTKTLDQLAVLRTRLDDRRTDWVEQTTTHLARTYDLVVIEDLRIPNMVRAPKPKPDPHNVSVFLSNGARAKASLNKAIHASRWGQFATRMGHKLPDGQLIRVDPRNTSRTCAACGHCASENRESQAVFECVTCGHKAHADTNAAINILIRGLEQSGLCITQPEDIGGSPASAAAPPRSRNQQTRKGNAPEPSAA